MCVCVCLGFKVYGDLALYVSVWGILGVVSLRVWGLGCGVFRSGASIAVGW